MWGLLLGAVSKALMGDSLASIIGGKVLTGSGMTAVIEKMITSSEQNFLSNAGESLAGVSDAETRNSVASAARSAKKPLPGQTTVELVSDTNYARSMSNISNWDMAMRSWSQYLNDEIRRTYYYKHPLAKGLLIPSIVGSGNEMMATFQISGDVDIKEVRKITINTIRKSTYRYVRAAAFGQNVGSVPFDNVDVSIEEG